MLGMLGSGMLGILGLPRFGRELPNKEEELPSKEELIESYSAACAAGAKIPIDTATAHADVANFLPNVIFIIFLLFYEDLMYFMMSQA